MHLSQLQQKDKVNMFVDRRFGENDATMTLEEKMLLRFAVERKVRPCFVVKDILRMLPLVLMDLS
jgi:hypothetical protein